MSEEHPGDGTPSEPAASDPGDASEHAVTPTVTPPEPEQTSEHAVTPPAPPPHDPVVTPEEKKAGWYVPRWAAAALALVLIAGIGFAIGWIAAPGGSDHDRRRAAVAPAPPAPRGRGGDGGGRVVPAPRPVARAFLGVSTQDATGSPSGAQITSVAAGSPAAGAGLQTGDVITAVDGNAVANARQLVERILSHQSGDQVTITYTRGGNSTQVKVTLGTRPGTATTTPTTQTQ